jgi:hypothetical protein
MDDHDIWEHIPEGIKHILDVLSVGTMLGTLFQMLPNIAALLTIIWTSLRILETDTVRNMTKRSNDNGEGQL